MTAKRAANNRIEVPDEHIALMYRDGLSTYEIADVTGYAQKTIWHRLRRMGEPTHPRGTNWRRLRHESGLH